MLKSQVEPLVHQLLPTALILAALQRENFLLDTTLPFSISRNASSWFSESRYASRSVSWSRSSCSSTDGQEATLAVIGARGYLGERVRSQQPFYAA